MVRSGFEAGGRRRKSRDALTSRPEIERLLDAARAPASPRELAGEHEAVELFARARLVDVSAPARKPATAGSPARRGVKAALAAAAAVGLLSSGVAFATTGHVPFVGTVKQVARHLTGQDDAGQDDSGHQAHQGDGRQGPKGDQVGLPHGPKAVAALQGLCHAYARGQKTSHGTALHQRPFQTLVTAAGGEDQVTDFCASLPAKAHQGGPGPSHPPRTRLTRAPGPATSRRILLTRPSRLTRRSRRTRPSRLTRRSRRTRRTSRSRPTRRRSRTRRKATAKPSRTSKPHPSQSAS